MRCFPATKGCDLLGVLILVCSIETGLTQVGSVQSPEGDSLAQRLVSTNQLLTPKKALRATDRAREDLRHGRVAAAQDEISRALDIAPHCALALFMQGAVELDSGDYKKASNSFQQAIDDDPALGSAHLGMGISLLAEGRYKDALIPLDRAAELLPDSWLVYFETALAHLKLGEAEAAFKQAALADRFTGTDPHKKSGVLWVRAIVYLKISDFANARKYLAETITRDPDGDYAMLAKRGLEQLQLREASRR